MLGKFLFVFFQDIDSVLHRGIYGAFHRIGENLVFLDFHESLWRKKHKLVIVIDFVFRIRNFVNFL